MTNFDLKAIRGLVVDLVEEMGADYKHRVCDTYDGRETAGCVNVVAVRDGKRFKPFKVAYDHVDEVNLTPELIESEGYKLERGCLIGSALINSGDVTAEQFVKGGLVGANIRAVARELDLTFTPGALTWAAWAQSAQDNGKSWGEALMDADSRLMSYLIDGEFTYSEL